MRVAVPVFGQDVAPRFGFAEEFLVADISNGNVVRESLISVSDAGWYKRLAELKGLGVELLLCGGFNRRFEPLAQTLGIEVVAGLAGEVSTLLESYARGEDLPVLYGCRAGSGRGRTHPGRRRQRGRNN
jgi:predicted Fe-Mo cluster-binding NifX family protein